MRWRGRGAGIAGGVLALLPLAFPIAVVAQNLTLTLGQDVRFRHGPDGVYAESRAWGIGPMSWHESYGPVLAAELVWLPNPPAPDESHSSNARVALALRTAQASHLLFSEFESGNAAVTLPSSGETASWWNAADTIDRVQAMLAGRVGADWAIKVGRPYPTVVAVFDVAAVVYTAAMVPLWTLPFLRRARRAFAGAEVAPAPRQVV